MALSVVAAPSHTAVADFDGLWRGDEGTLVRLRSCGAELCGEIVRPPRDGSELQLVSGFRQVSATRWGGGQVYDYGDGATYDVDLELLDALNIKVRACWIVFCDTLFWRRVE